MNDRAKQALRSNVGESGSDAHWLEPPAASQLLYQRVRHASGDDRPVNGGHCVIRTSQCVCHPIRAVDCSEGGYVSAAASSLKPRALENREASSAIDLS